MIFGVQMFVEKSMFGMQLFIDLRYIRMRGLGMFDVHTSVYKFTIISGSWAGNFNFFPVTSAFRIITRLHMAWQ